MGFLEELSLHLGKGMEFKDGAANVLSLELRNLCPYPKDIFVLYNITPLQFSLLPCRKFETRGII
jgi:hypothetical protein